MAEEQRVSKRGMLGDILVGRGLLKAWQLDKALQVQWNARPDTRLGRLLVELGFVTPSALYSALCFQNNLPETVL